MTRLGAMFVALGVGGLLAAPSWAIDVTDCGQTVPPRARAVLTTDLSCPAGAPAITLGNRVRLRLDGHTVTGGSVGVKCLGVCRVTGPGVITGSLTGIQSSAGERMVVKKVDVSGNAEYGIQLLSLGDGGHGRLTAVDVIASGNGATGVVAFPYLRGRNITASDNSVNAILTCVFSLKNLQAANNGEQGIVGCGGKLTASNLTGNDAAGAGVDVLTVGPPRLVATTCGKSAKLEGFDAGKPIVGPTWGVCAGD